MKKRSLKSQLISFCFTLVLIALSVFVFKNVNWIDYIIIGIGVLELIEIIVTIAKR